MQVPFVDLKAQFQEVREEVLAGMADVLDGMQLNPGVHVEAFEREFATYCGARSAVGVGSGTDALHLALRACGVGSGDEVITVAHTFAATTEAIVLAGATPVFVDVEPLTHGIDPSLVEGAITERTKALLPVHLYGHIADMEALREIADRHDLRIVEDACQAHGAVLGGRCAGTFGDAAAFSFYCGKNLGAYGEAGMVVTNSDTIAETIRMMRDHGSERKYHHGSFGLNARLDELQAVALRVKLPRLARWNAARRSHAHAYRSMLRDVPGVSLPLERETGAHVYHLYVIETDERDALRQWLGELGVGTGIHYPVPVHLQKPYVPYGGGPGSLPVTESKVDRVLSLPMYPELTQEQIAYVASAITSYFVGETAAQARAA